MIAIMYAVLSKTLLRMGIIMVTTILLVVIFIAYIGLGIPDSILGSAWPAIYTEIGADVSDVSMLSLIISLGTIVSSFSSERIVKRFKTAPVTIFSTALTVVALLGFSFSKNMVLLCLCAIPQGLGAGSIDVALNNYVAKHYNASHMNFLHCFYGVGVAMSPYLMSLFLKNDMNWRLGYRTMFYIQLAILIILALSLPLWKKVTSDKDGRVLQKSETVKFSVLLKNSAVRAQWFVFIGSCAIESMCLVWGSTYLVNAKGASPEYGAKLVTFYFAGLALGRFAAGLIVKKLSCEKIVYIGQALTFLSITILLLSNNTIIATIGLFLVGFGNGPLFPNMTQLTVKYFDESISHSIIGTQMGFSYVAILLTPIAFGVVSNVCGIGSFPIYLGVCFAIMMTATILLEKRVHKKAKQV